MRTLARYIIRVAATLLLSAASLCLSATRATADPTPPAVFGRANAETSNLSGEIAKLGYLIGKWTCEQAGGERTSTTTFEIAVGNTIHEHDIRPHRNESDEYFGYDAAAHYYYMTMANGAGTYGYAYSSDGVHFSYTIRSGLDTTDESTLSLQRPSPDTLAFHGEAVVNGAKTAGDSTCSH
jgi:hypothetical protein